MRQMQLNQYYTKNTYGDILVQSLSSASPRIALDLGFGTGNLLHAAKRRWDNLNLIGIDIDQDSVNVAKNNTFIEALELNGFEPSLPDIITDRFGDIDLLVSNPPYFAYKLDKNTKKILHSIGMLDCISSKLKNVPAELIFLAQNLRLLSSTGELGIILPAGLISGQRWQAVREFLFCNYCVSNVIQLPTGSFQKTDAQTFILTLKHRTIECDSIPLSHINELAILNISRQDAITRTDYSYHRQISNLSVQKDITINDFRLYRGNKSHNELAEMTNNHLHTTNMPDLFIKKSVIDSPLNGAKNTQQGDILISRVGRRCLGRTIYVDKGSIPISDCIIGIRPINRRVGKILWEKLSSQQCRNYLENVSLGVGAKYITYKIITDYLTNANYEIT